MCESGMCESVKVRGKRSGMPQKKPANAGFLFISSDIVRGELGDPSGFLFIASGIVLGRAW